MIKVDQLPCGCTVPYNLGRIMRWLLSANLIKAYDCIHSESFVRRHRKRGKDVCNRNRAR